MAEISPVAVEERSPELDAFVRAFGEFGGVERRYAHIAGLQTRDNGDPDSLFSATGRAIVFDSYSLDLGGFKEEIAPEAVREAMDAEDADYHLLWDHDTTLVLARNTNGTLKAEISEDGVDFWGRVAKTSYAADLRTLMDRKDIDECSFAFTIDPEGEEWRLEEDGTIVRRITKIKRLWDLTICARGAYPATNSASIRSFVLDTVRTRSAEQITNDMPAAPDEERALTPGLIAWDDEQGFCDIACDIERSLNEGEDWATYWWVVDLNVRDGGTEAILCKSVYGQGSTYSLAQGITYDAAGEPTVPQDGLQAVEEMWVAVTMAKANGSEGGDDDIEEYTAKLVERNAQALANRRSAAHAAVDAQFEVRTDLEEIPAADEEPVVEDAVVAAEDDVPAEDEAPVEDEVAVEDEVPAEEEPASDDGDEERKRAAAMARARGRAASV